MKGSDHIKRKPNVYPILTGHNLGSPCGDRLSPSRICFADNINMKRNIKNVIMEYLVKISKKAHILELKQRNMKKLTLTSYTSYPSRKIWCICACTSQETSLYVVGDPFMGRYVFILVPADFDNRSFLSPYQAYLVQLGKGGVKGGGWGDGVGRGVGVGREGEGGRSGEGRGGGETRQVEGGGTGRGVVVGCAGGDGWEGGWCEKGGVRMVWKVRGVGGKDWGRWKSGGWVQGCERDREGVGGEGGGREGRGVGEWEGERGGGTVGGDQREEVGGGYARSGRGGKGSGGGMGEVGAWVTGEGGRGGRVVGRGRGGWVGKGGWGGGGGGCGDGGRGGGRRGCGLLRERSVWEIVG
ncbi:hypothetical protein Tco_1352601 [Tanacetum coccineum]